MTGKPHRWYDGLSRPARLSAEKGHVIASELQVGGTPTTGYKQAVRDALLPLFVGDLLIFISTEPVIEQKDAIRHVANRSCLDITAR